MKKQDKMYFKKLEEIFYNKSIVKKKIPVAAGIIMKNGEKGESVVLLIQRAADDHFPLMFEVPRGKCEDKDKNIIACLKREVKEETGLDIEPIRFIDKFSYIAEKGERISTQYNYLCRMKDENQKIKLSKEHDDYKWVTTMGEVTLQVMPELRRTISKVLNPDESVANEIDPKDITIEE